MEAAANADAAEADALYNLVKICRFSQQFIEILSLLASHNVNN